MLGAVTPGISSHSPFFQSRTSNGCAISPRVSCRIGVSTTSLSTPSTPSQSSENFFATALKISQSLFDSNTGSTAADSGWMNGCMSVVLRSFFSYHDAVFAEVLALQTAAGAEEMLEEILVALAGRTKQVGAPDEQVAREVHRIVRVLAGQPDVSGLQRRRRSE